MRSFAVWYDTDRTLGQMSFTINFVPKEMDLTNDREVKPQTDASFKADVNKDEAQKQLSVPKDMLHVNFWSNLPYDGVCYFDFGIYVEDMTKVNNIYVYCPFKVSKENIRDLGARMSSDNLVNALFNENYITTNGNAKRYLIDKNNENNEKFIIYAIDEDNEIEIEPCKRYKYKSDIHQPESKGKGTIISFKLNSLVGHAPKTLRNIKSYYFRFRIEVRKENLKLISKNVKSESWVSDTLVTTEVMDFRINDIRSCCDEVQDRFNRGKHFNLKSIHYLVMRNADDRVIAEGNKYTCRLLELDIWEKYIDILKDNIIAYHFKEKSVTNEPVKSLCVLVRFQTRNSEIVSKAKYLFVALIVAVLSTAFSNYILGK